MARVKLQKVSKIYDGDVLAVNEADLTIEDREFVVLVGPSGCGKSTMLRMIAGLEEISSGDLYIEDNRVNDVSPKDRDIAMVFQNYALYPHMTVFDNMAFGLKLRKYPKDEIKQRVVEASEILDIKEYLDRKPKALSGGQRQRVAIGRAIVRKPKVFLFDEPLSNLDAKLRVQMRIEINRLHSRLQSTMIYVTHDQVEAMTMGDRIVVLKDGIIQQVDTPLGLYNNPQNLFVAGFIGSPAMNFLNGELKKNGRLSFSNADFTITIPADKASKLEKSGVRDICLGIRPENITLKGGSSVQNLSEAHSAHVDVVEPVGNEMYLYTTTGSHSLCIRTAPNADIRARSSLDIVFDLHHIYYFDAKTEERIA